ncbi:hypothetical protein ABEB36_010952 [Hypothenemus hampei]|uniref:Homeobox domain-containing protein n=1 Tax=Hypothenemus hampei TaxID=57062 RepID=A0ABD1EHV6_HYPHA
MSETIREEKSNGTQSFYSEIHISADNFSESGDNISWHEHVYRTNKIKPTPHFIENILGIVKTHGKTRSNEQPLNLSVKTQNTKESDCRKRKSIREIKNSNANSNQSDDLLLENGFPNIETPPQSIVKDDIFENKKGKKKARTTFTGRQIFELEKRFEQKKYLSSSERTEISKSLNITETQNSSYTSAISYILVKRSIKANCYMKTANYGNKSERIHKLGR